MTSASGFGYLLISLGPAFSLFVLAISHKSFLVLTVITSALLWLVTLVAIASLWRAFLPLQPSFLLFAVLLLSAVGIQEIVRVLLWRVFKKVEVALDSLAVKLSKPCLSTIDRLELALATGLGHGSAHSLFFCLSILTPAFGPATFYIDTCRQLPYFLIIALTSLGFFIIHTCGMVIAFCGYLEGSKRTQLFVPVIHFTAALLTTVNMIPGGCTLGVSLILFVAGLEAVVCGKIIWDKIGEEITATGPQRRAHFG